MKTFSILTTAVAASLALGSCVHTGPDYTPIGDGLKAIGVALVAYGVVGALADLIRAGDKPNPPKPTAQTHRSGRTGVIARCSLGKLPCRSSCFWRSPASRSSL